jgi:quercetin dioxygenase-like cupin family protein
MIVVNSNSVKAIENKSEIVEKGPVLRKQLIDANTTGSFGAALVTFRPGARLNFHTHEAEQILFVTEGKGIIATRDKENVVTPGTIIFIPPGEDHWHGATEDSSFTHVAIQKSGIKLSRLSR